MERKVYIVTAWIDSVIVVLILNRDLIWSIIYKISLEFKYDVHKLGISQHGDSHPGLPPLTFSCKPADTLLSCPALPQAIL